MSAQDLAMSVLIRAGKEADPKSVAMLAKSIHSSFSRQRRPVVEYDRSTWPGKRLLKV